MDSPTFLNLAALPAPYVPAMVFFARIIDVSLGTLRIVVVGRGNRLLASALGFAEVFIWLIAISQVLQNLHGLASFLSYSAGFAAGTFVGMTIERRISIGTSIIRIVVPRDASDLVEHLVEHNHGVTHVEGQGARGPVSVVFSVVKHRGLNDIMQILKKYKPDAFYSIEDVRRVKDYDSRMPHYPRHQRLLQPFFWFRKSK